MSRPIEQALLSLLPTQNSNLPVPLVELAGSLLAQSRNKVSTLKAEEEIARTYACSHIACNRLKIPLNLPPIDPRPPVAPRIYRRIYTLLDNALPKSASAGRPKANGRRTPASLARSSPASRATPSRGTPTEGVSLAQFRTPGKLNGQGPIKQRDSLLPSWIRPTVRYICTKLAADKSKDFAPTIEAGLDAIVAPFRKRTQDEWVNSHLTMLIGAIYWFVSETATLAPGEKMVDPAEAAYRGARKNILSALRSARIEIPIPTSTERGKKVEVTEELEAIFWAGWQDSIKAADFDQTITQVTNSGYLESDWYRSVDFLRDAVDDGQEPNDIGEDPAYAAAHAQATRPDTMLQDKFDYLSERRMADYRMWEAGILRRIKLLESGQVTNAMDVDA